MFNPIEMIENRLAEPKLFVVVTTYDDGTEYRVPVARREAAELFASIEGRKVGREYESRKTGKTIKVTSVTVI